MRFTVAWANNVRPCGIIRAGGKQRCAESSHPTGYRSTDIKNRPAKRDGFREVLFLLLRRRAMMTAAAAVGAVAAAADGLLDEDRTDREEHDSHYDQCQNDITNTHG